MRVTFYPDEGALYIKLGDAPVAYGKDLDD